MAERSAFSIFPSSSFLSFFLKLKITTEIWEWKLWLGTFYISVIRETIFSFFPRLFTIVTTKLGLWITHGSELYQLELGSTYLTEKNNNSDLAKGLLLYYIKSEKRLSNHGRVASWSHHGPRCLSFSSTIHSMQFPSSGLPHDPK